MADLSRWDVEHQAKRCWKCVSHLFPRGVDLKQKLSIHNLFLVFIFLFFILDFLSLSLSLSLSVHLFFLPFLWLSVSIHLSLVFATHRIKYDQAAISFLFYFRSLIPPVFFFGSIFIFTSTFTFIFVFVFVLISIFIVIIYDSYIFIYYRQLGASFSQRFSVEGSLQTPSIRWRKRILAALNGGGISFQKDPGEMANDIGRILRVISWFQRLFPTPSDPKNEWN